MTVMCVNLNILQGWINDLIVVRETIELQKRQASQ